MTPIPRAPITILLALALAGAACTAEPPAVPEGAPRIDDMAADLGADVVGALRRGYYEGRSVDIAFVPKPNNVVVRWSGKGVGTDAADPRTTHSTPWDYHQRIPMMLYGPGFVRPGATVDRSVDLTDIAATVAEVTGAPFEAPAGETLSEALLPPNRRSGAPKVVVVVAYDGGGWNLLAEWPDAWPVQRDLADRGTTYLNATIGSAPAVTTAIHATMGTGAYPQTHGLPEITGRLPDGSIGDMWLDVGDPELLEVETVADVWDAANGNEPWTGIIAYETWHMGMMGKGSKAEGGDADPAVLWERETFPGEFHTNDEFYELPDYLPPEDALLEHLRDLDGADGAIDDSWMGHDLTDPAIVPGTPAFVRHQEDALEEMLDHEPIGTDSLTDMLFLELKPTDFGGHIWNMVEPEEEFVLRAQDDLLGTLVETLDRTVGPDDYLLMVTADHGQTPKPESVDGLRVHPDILGRAIDAHFEAKVVQKVTPSGIFLDRKVLEDAGFTEDQVARFVAQVRYGDILPDDVPGGAVPADVAEAQVFAGVLPTSYLGRLSDADVEALGPGAYPEGDLTTPQPWIADLLGG